MGYFLSVMLLALSLIVPNQSKTDGYLNVTVVYTDYAGNQQGVGPGVTITLYKDYRSYIDKVFTDNNSQHNFLVEYGIYEAVAGYSNQVPPYYYKCQSDRIDHESEQDNLVIICHGKQLKTYIPSLIK